MIADEVRAVVSAYCPEASLERAAASVAGQVAGAALNHGVDLARGVGAAAVRAMDQDSVVPAGMGAVRLDARRVARPRSATITWAPPRIAGGKR